jgi:hypothetical protein
MWTIASLLRFSRREINAFGWNKNDRAASSNGIYIITTKNKNLNCGALFFSTDFRSVLVND